MGISGRQRNANRPQFARDHSSSNLLAPLPAVVTPATLSSTICPWTGLGRAAYSPALYGRSRGPTDESRARRRLRMQARPVGPAAAAGGPARRGGLSRDLLVGTETGDDAAVWRLDGDTCVIATTDFFMPIVDDPADFGRIAATNAMSDVYAMGGRPIMALAILGMPLGKIATGDGARHPARRRRRSARAPAFRSPAVIRSTRPSRSTGSP